VLRARGHVNDPCMVVSCARALDLVKEQVREKKVAKVVDGKLGIITVLGLLAVSKHDAG
jgi:hypothetical protein